MSTLVREVPLTDHEPIDPSQISSYNLMKRKKGFNVPANKDSYLSQETNKRLHPYITINIQILDSHPI